MTLVLRRCGRGNWAPLQLNYEARLHPAMPMPVEVKIVTVLELFGVRYRIAAILT